MANKRILFIVYVIVQHPLIQNYTMNIKLDRIESSKQKQKQKNGKQNFSQIHLYQYLPSSTQLWWIFFSINKETTFVNCGFLTQCFVLMHSWRIIKDVCSSFLSLILSHSSIRIHSHLSVWWWINNFQFIDIFNQSINIRGRIRGIEMVLYAQFQSVSQIAYGFSINCCCYESEVMILTISLNWQ